MHQKNINMNYRMDDTYCQDTEFCIKLENFIRENKDALLNIPQIRDIVESRKIKDEHVCDYLTKFFMAIYFIYHE